MPVMVIDLVSGKKQKVRFQLLDVRNDIGFRYVSAVLRIDRVARKCSHDDCIFIDRILADNTRIICAPTVSETVFNIFCGIPVLNPENRRPAPLDYLRLRYLFPSSILLDFEPDHSVFTILQWIQLGSHFHDVVADSVQSKANNFVPGHFGDLQELSVGRI
ncbi:hypothetical protein ES703_122450 [subsurface metagenome]